MKPWRVSPPSISAIFLFTLLADYAFAQNHLACSASDSAQANASECLTPPAKILSPRERLLTSQETRRRYLENIVIDNRDGDYQRSPDASRLPDAPTGEIHEFEWNDSEAFPGTHRRYWVYVPAQYEASKAAALMIFQDGTRFLDDANIPTLAVIDNLMHQGDMPITIAVFVEPGHYPGKEAADSIRTGQRQIEYDTQSDAYARLLVDEILPQVGKRFNITDDPDQRAICGASSGGMAAFNAAWQRPDEFGKVISFIGSFTNIHGGHNAAYNVRSQPARPIRVFLQSGQNDLQLEFGDWALANQTMASALAYAGYDYRFVFGDGAHDTAHASAILPEVFRWIWRPTPGKTNDPT